jgi:hypothetical protein
MYAIAVVQRGSSVRSIPMAALTEELSDAAIGTICSKLGHRWRDRQLPPPVMVRSMIHRSLHPNHSIRATRVPGQSISPSSPRTSISQTRPATLRLSDDPKENKPEEP